MTLKEKINYMLEQYSMTKDNPTVLRELRRLAALTAEVVEWVENNDPTDFTEQLNEVNARLDEIEALVKSLNLDTINADIAALKVSVAEAQANANSAKTSAESALTASENAVSDVAALEASVNEFKDTVNSQIETITVSVNEATTKAESAGSKADEAVTASNEAKTAAGAAGKKADAAKATADSAKTTADSAKASAEQASTDVQEMQLALEGKQDTLTFDSSPTSGSENPVTSDGIYKAIQAGSGTITLDDTVTPNSQNGVKSSGIYTAIESAKTELNQNITNVDTKVNAQADEISALHEFQQTQEITNETHNTQIAANTNSINGLSTDKQNRFYKTGGSEPEYPLDELANIIPETVEPEAAVQIPTLEAVSDALNTKQGVLTFDESPVKDSSNPVTSGGVFTALIGKQDNLTFDSTPTEGSDNPVTSDGIYKAIAAGSSTITLDDTVTAESQNGVKSSGIYTAIQAVQTDLDGQKDLISANTDAISAANIKIASLEENKQTVAGELATLSGDVAALDADKMNKMDVDNVPTASSTNLVESGGVYEYGEDIRQAANSALNVADGKQDKLTFDTTPRNGSQNPVTSGGLYTKFNSVMSEINDKQDEMYTVDASGGSIHRNISPYVLPTLTEQPVESSHQLATAYAIWNAIQSAAGGSGGGSVVTISTRWTAKGTSRYNPTSALPDGFIPLFIVLNGRVDIFDVSFLLPVIRTSSPTSYISLGTHIANHASKSVDLLMPTADTMKIGYNETYSEKLSIKYESLTYARFLSGSLVLGSEAQMGFNRDSYIIGIQS